jgi:hypothetical protein
MYKAEDPQIIVRIVNRLSSVPTAEPRPLPCRGESASRTPRACAEVVGIGRSCFLSRHGVRIELVAPCYTWCDHG